MLSYPVILEPDEGRRVLVEFPDFPEAHTYGDDQDEALMRARDALATIIDAYIKDRQPIPEPSVCRGAPRVRVPALTAAKVELYRTMLSASVTKTQLARKLGWHLPQVDRLLDVQHNSRLEQLEAAFAALGKELLIASVDQQTPAQRGRIGIRAGAATGMGTTGAGRAPGNQPRRRHRAPRAGKRKGARKREP